MTVKYIYIYSHVWEMFRNKVMLWTREKRCLFGFIPFSPTPLGHILCQQSLFFSELSHPFLFERVCLCPLLKFYTQALNIFRCTWSLFLFSFLFLSWICCIKVQPGCWRWCWRWRSCPTFSSSLAAVSSRYWAGWGIYGSNRMEYIYTEVIIQEPPKQIFNFVFKATLKTSLSAKHSEIFFRRCVRVNSEGGIFVRAQRVSVSGSQQVEHGFGVWLYERYLAVAPLLVLTIGNSNCAKAAFYYYPRKCTTRGMLREEGTSESAFGPTNC